MHHYIEMLKDVVASIIGSAACVYTGQPFDTVKVRMQVQPGHFRNAIHCMQRTIRGEGIRALWRGSLPAFLGALGENAVGFAVNGELKRLFISFDSPFKPFVIGGITGLFTAIALCPSDVIKSRAQVSRIHGGSGSMMEIVRATYGKQGIRGFYTGIQAQLMRDGPFYLSFFGTYDTLCGMLKTRFPSWPDSAVYFVSGGIAGQAAWVVAMPADVVKSIVQTSEKHVTVLSTVSKILREQGPQGFTNGMQVALIRAFPANAALFVGYEFARKFLG